MKSVKIWIALMSICLLVISCDCDDDHTQTDCDEVVVISEAEYANAPNDQADINSLEINGDCLIINFGASGCDGSSWELKLIDAALLMESDPPQRSVRLSLKNEELCDAYFTKEISFDISELQVEGNQVFLNMENNGEQILYEY